MFELREYIGKRVMAILLVFAMMFAMLGDYAPAWFAVAEEVSEDSGSSGSEADSSEHHESSHSDGGSSDSQSSHADGGSSDSQSSHADGGSSDSQHAPIFRGDIGSHESSSSDDNSSEGHESSLLNSGSSEGHESSVPDSAIIGDISSESDSSDSQESSGSEDASTVSVDSIQETASPDDSEVPDTAEGDDAIGDVNVLETADSHNDGEAQPSEEGEPDGEAQTPEESDPDGEARTSEESESDGEAQTPEESESEGEAQTPEESESEGEAQTPEEGESEAAESASALPASTLPISLSLGNGGESADAATAGAFEEEISESPEEIAPLSEPESTFETVAYTAPAAIALSAASDGGAPQISILQNMVDEALASVTGTLTGRLQVILGRNTNYEGDVTISVGSRTVADDFALELTAEDAGDDGMKGEGYTTVDGNLAIMGLRVVMNSVSMVNGKAVTVAGNGALEYNGNRGINNVLNVNVGQGSSAEINLTDTSDNITVTAQDGAKFVSINAGDGMNTVNATVNSGDFSAVTGSASDTVNLDLEGNGLGAIYVDTGDNVDELNITDNGAAESPVTWEKEYDDEGNEISRTLTGGVYVSSGSGDDAINVDVRANAGDITVDSGLGIDTISVYKGDHRTPETIDYTKVYNPYRGKTHRVAGRRERLRP